MSLQPFILNQVYKRSKIHDQYGGNRQSGVCPSSSFPFIFIFYGKTGKQHGYEDGWDNKNIFTYTGHGQKGDMKFERGNLAIRDHLKNGKKLLLFEGQAGGMVKFVGEVEYFDVDYFETPDTQGNIRTAIKFFLKRIGADIPNKIREIHQGNLFDDTAIQRNLSIPNETERKGLVTSRVGQGMYRKRVIHRWEYQCAVTGFDNLELLIASHIVPWAESNDLEKLDVDNGLLLSPVYDALFDRHLITFSKTGRIMLSSNLTEKNYKRIGVGGSERIKNLSKKNKEYLERHQEAFYQKQLK